MTEEGQRVVRIGPIAIPILADDDPRIIERQLGEARAVEIVAPMTTVDELLAALSADDQYVRRLVVRRLRAEAINDPGVAEAMLELLTQDEDVVVRKRAAYFFSDLAELSARQLDVLRAAGAADEPIRNAVALSLFQRGHGPNPYEGQF